MEIKLIFIFVVWSFSLIVSGREITWHGKWAYACWFECSLDCQTIKSEISNSAYECESICEETRGCTHYNWHSGYCILRKGIVSKSSASAQSDRSYICGISSRLEIIWSQNQAYKCDFKGNNLKNERINIEDCGPTCENTQECTHYVWSDHYGGTCWLKKGRISKSLALFSDENSKICGLSSLAFINGLNLTWIQNEATGCDFDGKDLKNLKTSRQECGPTCEETPDCTHYTWSSQRGGTCWMKKGSVSKADAFQTADPSMSCGISTLGNLTAFGIIWEGNVARACDFYKSNLKNIRTKRDECGPTCENTPGCTHYTWDTQHGGTCWMKKGPVTKKDALQADDSSKTCGLSSLANFSGRFIKWVDHRAYACKFEGKDLKKMLTTIEECGSVCENHVQCTFYNWHKGVCWMKWGSKPEAIFTADYSMICGVAPKYYRRYSHM